MKIVFIISSLDSGGAERVLVNLANYFSKNNDIFVVTFSNNEPFYKLNKNIKLIKLNLLKQSNNKVETFVNTIRRIYILTKTFKILQADINISFMTHTNILSITSSKIIGNRIIVSEDIEYYFYNNKLLFLIRGLVYRFSDALIVKTKSDKKNYRFLKKVHVIGNPLPRLPNKNFNDIFAQKEPFILAVGRLDNQKGFDILIETYAKIHTDWKLYIIGEGKERYNLQNLIKRLGLKEKVVLLGRKEDIFSWYERASVFVLSSRKEGFGNVLIEAMAFGCAVVSFDCPHGPAEIIENGENGLLVKNQDVNELASALKRLIHDESLRSKLGKEALKVRHEYAIEKIAAQWMEILQNVAS